MYWFLCDRDLRHERVKGSWLYHWLRLLLIFMKSSKAAFRRCSLKYMFLKMSQISQENTFIGVSF